MSKKTKLILILGPTSVGKTQLAIEISKKIGASIISADSLQVYKYLDIGTAKPTVEQRADIPHYLIDIIEPDQDFNAGTFRKLTLSHIDQLSKNNEKIVIVGGTFLYVKVLLSGLLENIGIDQYFRKELKIIRDKRGSGYLHDTLRNIDPDSAERINKNDYVRIERALEVFHLTGETMSFHQNNHAFQDNRFETYKIGLNTKRENIRSRIDKRVDQMVKDGLVEEVLGLRRMGYLPTLKPMQSIGYKQINRYLDGDLKLERAVEIIKRDTKRFAKRQMTWLRSEVDIQWFDINTNYNKIIEKCKNFHDS